MGRLLNFLLYILAGFAALVIIASITLFLVFDQNDFRESVSIAVEKNTGRTLVIEGDIDIDLFPWLAIDIGNTRLGNAAGFGDTPFASFERARLSVRVMPMLLRQEIAIGTAEIESLALNLEVRPDGLSNWQDLMDISDAAEQAPQSASGETAQFEIGGVEVSNASVSYRDQQTGETYRLVEFDLTSTALTGTDPVQIASSFGFELQPAEITGTIEMKTELGFDGDAGLVTLKDFVLEGLIEGVAEMPATLRLEAPALEANTTDEVLSPGQIELSVVGIDLIASVEPFSYAGDPAPNATIRIEPFSLRSLMQRMDIEAPETADPNALGKISVDAKAGVTANAISLSDLVLVMDDSTFKGALVVPRNASGTYRLDLAADSIDLNRYMAPADETEAVADTGEVPVEIPSDLIRPLNARGSLKIGEALLGGLTFESVVLELNAANGDLRVHPISAAFFEGTYNGDVRINVAGATPVLTVDESISHVQLAPLALAMFEQENITGEINGSFKLTGKGQNLNAMQRSLNGSMSFEFLDGALEGTDIWYELRRARAMLKQEAAPEPVLPPRTKFSSITASGVVTDGVFNNNDLVADIPFMRVTGKGSIDLAKASLDYRMTARVLERPEFEQGASAAELDEFTEAVIPLRITGPLSSPSVKPDIGAMLKKEVEKEVKKQLTDMLRGGRDDSESAEADGTGEEAPAEEESIEDAAKNALFDLLKN